MDLFWEALLSLIVGSGYIFTGLVITLRLPFFAICLILRRPRRLAVHDHYNAAPYFYAFRFSASSDAGGKPRTSQSGHTYRTLDSISSWFLRFLAFLPSNASVLTV